MNILVLRDRPVSVTIRKRRGVKDCGRGLRRLLQVGLRAFPWQ